jgi:hypothetical protein
MTDVLPDLAPVSPSTFPSPAPETPEEALSWLGGTVEEVAEGLRARGIKGERHKGADRCPIANYLNQWYSEASVCTSMFITKEIGISRPCPPVIGEFVARWDKREFPDLIAD